MSEPIRRRQRKRRTNSNEVDLSLIALPKSPPHTNTETKDDDASSGEPQMTVDFGTTSHQAIYDRIRSEINKDQYHCSLNEPDYSNDTHDWDDNYDESASSDYWHFLGLYE